MGKPFKYANIIIMITHKTIQAVCFVQPGSKTSVPISIILIKVRRLFLFFDFILMNIYLIWVLSIKHGQETSRVTDLYFGTSWLYRAVIEISAAFDRNPLCGYYFHSINHCYLGNWRNGGWQISRRKLRSFIIWSLDEMKGNRRCNIISISVTQNVSIGEQRK